MCEMKKLYLEAIFPIRLFCISGICMFCSINEEKSG